MQHLIAFPQWEGDSCLCMLYSWFTGSLYVIQAKGPSKHPRLCDTVIIPFGCYRNGNIPVIVENNKSQGGFYYWFHSYATSHRFSTMGGGQLFVYVVQLVYWEPVCYSGQRSIQTSSTL
ncbi:hypothetical protein GOP47_0009874 [Adiantum capillus-veneris]|uniref:Uncharacterized protein n=1 Tax=Adiantum capillus-veneris TaxID=13818 RepID=A0A9D4UY97_ADICA|nr:hypothetical protein GOP47_0009874 [Adiantum capillus-veneris]